MRALTTAKYVPCEPFAAIQILIHFFPYVPGTIPGASQSRFYQRPTTSHPMTVTTIDELVRPSSKASFGCVLPRREPGNKSINVEKPGDCDMGYAIET